MKRLDKIEELKKMLVQQFTPAEKVFIKKRELLIGKDIPLLIYDWDIPEDQTMIENIASKTGQSLICLKKG